MSKTLKSLVVILFWYSSCAYAQTLFPVPNIPGVCGVSGVIVTMSGGSGGSSNSTGTGFPDGGMGGMGGAIACTLNVAVPVVVTSLTYYVGLVGADGLPVYTGTTGAFGGAGYGTGGNAGNFAGASGGIGTDISGGGGGGSSAVLNTTTSTVLLVAAGGGGGGALSTTVPGGAGGNPGAAGGSFSPNFGGAGGTPGSFGAAGGAGIAYSGIAAGASAPGNGGNGGEGLTGSQSGGGGGAGYGGGGGGGAGNTISAGVNTVTAGGGGGANYVNGTSITVGLSNGTATTAGNGAVSLVLYPNIATTTGVVLCTGGTSTFTESTPGGTWSSSDPTIATVSATTGTSITVTGVSAGTANISYTASAGFWSFVTVTIHAGAAPIAGPTTVCVSQTINLSDTTAGGSWTCTPASIATISASGVLTGVSAGTAYVTYTLASGCNATAPITVSPFPDPIGGTLSVCVGSTTLLSDAIPGGTWSSAGTAIATINPTSGLASGVTPGISVITYGFGGGCVVTANLIVNALPVITNVESTNPTTCGGSDGTITLDGLASGTMYAVNYTYNGVPATPVNITGDGSGQVIINLPSTGLLPAGSYTGIYVTNTTTGCTSSPAGPITLSNPPNPPTPQITSPPLCNHQTLMLDATDAWPGGAYSWTGPSGFTSTLQNASILDATYTNSGVYTVVYTLFNCTSLPATINITVQAPPVLTNVTPSQSIAYGTSIQLYASNTLYYWWTPNDGTLNNPNINNPIATPIVTTLYTVYGMNMYGCRDSAYITITVASMTEGVMPSAFTPNNDGLNDVFRPVGFQFQRLAEFRVFNRWGQQVFYSNSMSNGWDGNFNGVPQETGIYYYQILVTRPDGDGYITYKGDVTLLR